MNALPRSPATYSYLCQWLGKEMSIIVSSFLPISEDDVKLFNPSLLNSILKTQLNNIVTMDCDENKHLLFHISNISQPLLSLKSFSACGSSLEDVKDPILLNILSKSPLLTELKLYSNAIKNLSINGVFARCRHLKKISIEFYSEFRGKEFRELADNCPLITELHLGWCHHIYDEDLIYAVNKWPNLSYFSLINCSHITNLAITHIFNNCPKLSTVKLPNNNLLNNLTVKLLVENCPLLSVLDISRCGDNGMNEDTLLKIAISCPLLREINVSGSKYLSPTYLFHAINNCKKLAVINVTNCYLVDDKAVAELQHKLDSFNRGGKIISL